MQPDQGDDRPGEKQHVERVEAAERVGVDVCAALQELGDEGPEERRRAVDVDPDGRRPVRRLVPRQQVAGEALEQARARAAARR